MVPGLGRVLSAAVSGRGSAFEVRSVTPLFSFVAAGQRFNYDVTRDGQRFLVNTGLEASQSSPLTVVINWLEALKK